MHFQWLAVPELDRWLLRHARAARVHSPRPAAAAHGRQARPLADAASAASSAWSCTASAGSRRWRPSACPRSALRVIRTPSRRAIRRATDDGATVLALGVIRPYKQVDHAAAAVRRVAGARLLVAGDPAGPLPPLDGADLRLGYLPAAEVERALGDATVAVFPVSRRARPVRRAPPGARRGACRRSSTTSAGSPSRCAHSAPAASCRPTTWTRSRRPCASCSATPTRSPRRAAGARRARETLTWDASAAATSRALPRAGVIFRRTPFADLVARQLDLVAADDADLLDDVRGEAPARHTTRRPRGRRGGLRRLPARARGAEGAPRRRARHLRGDARRGSGAVRARVRARRRASGGRTSRPSERRSLRPDERIRAWPSRSRTTG